MAEPRRYVCAACNDVSVVREEPPEDRCMLCDHDEWRDDGKPNWPSDQGARIAKLEAALREIAGTYDETEQTATKLCSALYAVSRLAAQALTKPTT